MGWPRQRWQIRHGGRVSVGRSELGVASLQRVQLSAGKHTGGGWQARLCGTEVWNVRQDWCRCYTCDIRGVMETLTLTWSFQSRVWTKKEDSSVQPPPRCSSNFFILHIYSFLSTEELYLAEHSLAGSSKSSPSMLNYKELHTALLSLNYKQILSSAIFIS